MKIGRGFHRASLIPTEKGGKVEILALILITIYLLNKQR